jgi:glycoside/pentoside/hexuronide:cation symporter, GPH family
MGLLATLLFLFCFFTTTERIKHNDDRRPVIEQLKLLLKNDQWVILAAVCLVGTIGYVIRGSVAAYYAKYYLHGSATLMSLFLSTGVAAAILAMVASTWITKRYCKIKLFRQSQIIVAILGVMIFFLVKQNDVVLAFILYFLLSFVVDLHAPVFWSAIAEAVDYGEVKLGGRVAGLAFGGISFFQKAGMGIAGAMVGLLLTYYKYVPDKPQTAFALTGIALMLSIIPGFFHLLMGLLMYRYRITDQYYNSIKQSRFPAVAA